MLTFNKNEFTLRLHKATVNLLDLAIGVKVKEEQKRLFDKRSAVEECLAWWFGSTIDLDDDDAKDMLPHLAGAIRLQLNSPEPPNAAKQDGYKMVLSYINEY